ncbi:hypothetical protein BFP70_06695 [Thioclava sp. SK-1]|uniref:ABC transporter permease n=1 Tax=Thioclava sp. SK-1 TaxID=1889770 RepID=UPI0008265C53|nr:ABC transporter permease subunit [Thioclava sp. SK-1]OCX65824.1 hypothetical protein BFP70_06695 [Thioclava sp. SK-1]
MIWLRLLLLMLVGGPVVAGAGLTLWMACFGPLGAQAQPFGAGFVHAVAQPGMGHGLWLTVATGAGSAALTVVLSIPLSGWMLTRAWARAAIAPLLAVPHAALAIGLAFIIAPSGWVARLIAPAAQWALPPLWLTPGDPWGLSLIVGLVLKELPFMLLMTLSAAGQVPVAAQVAAGRSLGYSRAYLWARVIWPQILPALRLPMFIVLAYGLSNVDMALLLGPSHPPVLAVQSLRLFTAPDPAMIAPASAMAVILVVVMAGVVIAGMWMVRLCGVVNRWGLERGVRRSVLNGLVAPIYGLYIGLAILAVLALMALPIWSLLRGWSWPLIWPQAWTVQHWLGHDGWHRPALSTVWLGAVVTLISVGICIAWLETEDRLARRAGLWPVIILPLVLPQMGFVPGFVTLQLLLKVPPGTMAVLWAQLVFVLPYVMISLSGPWRRLDPQMLRQAAALGAGPWRRLWAVKLPILLGPIALAAAIGFAVSVAQYLAVLLPGAGRVVTVTTEGIALASGASRSQAGVQGVLQAALPLIGFGWALGLAWVTSHNRRGLRGGLA